MAKSVAAPKKRRGRPATGRDAVTAIRLAVDLRRRLNAGSPDAPEHRPFTAVPRARVPVGDPMTSMG
jgi:hypothetical protein